MCHLFGIILIYLFQILRIPSLINPSHRHSPRFEIIAINDGNTIYLEAVPKRYSDLSVSANQAIIVGVPLDVNDSEISELEPLKHSPHTIRRLGAGNVVCVTFESRASALAFAERGFVRIRGQNCTCRQSERSLYDIQKEYDLSDYIQLESALTANYQDIHPPKPTEKKQFSSLDGFLSFFLRVYSFSAPSSLRPNSSLFQIQI